MSLQECEIAQRSPYQLEKTNDSNALASEQSPFPIIQDKWLDFLWATTEIPCDTSLKSIGTPISTQELEKSSVHPMSS